MPRSQAPKEDLGTARDWLMKAENHPKALFALGYLDEQQGRYGTAIELYKQAKAEGSLAAAYNLGRCREIGRGTVKNIKKAEDEYLYRSRAWSRNVTIRNRITGTIKATKNKRHLHQSRQMVGAGRENGSSRHGTR